MDKELAANAAGKQRGRPFKKGESGNPKGKIKGTKNYSTRLDEALNEIETLKGKTLFKRFMERAFASDKVLIAAMKKFIPDMSQSEIKVEDIYRPYKDLSDEELLIKANEIFNRTAAPGSRRDISRA